MRPAIDAREQHHVHLRQQRIDALEGTVDRHTDDGAQCMRGNGAGQVSGHAGGSDEHPATALFRVPDIVTRGFRGAVSGREARSACRHDKVDLTRIGPALELRFDLCKVIRYNGIAHFAEAFD